MPKKSVKNIEDVYRRVPIARHYSRRQRITIWLISHAFYLLIKITGKTIRFETDGWENFEAIERSGKPPIYAFWHNRIFLATYYFRHRGIVVMSSQSYDGEYIASFIKRFGFGVLRGSSTRGGVGALVEMIRLMRQGLPMGFTMDGPKGPKYVAKTGACLLAKKTGNPIMPFMLEAEKYWSVKNWDNLQIPKPFSRARVFIAEPLFVEKDANDARIEECRVLLQAKLDELVELGKQWRASIGK
jgi:hypothetical protein